MPDRITFDPVREPSLSVFYLRLLFEERGGSNTAIYTEEGRGVKTDLTRLR